MKLLKDINIRNKQVLIRVDYNVPIENGVIKDYFRLNASIPTIQYCLTQNSKIVLMSHLGRPKNKEENLSLEPIVGFLEETFNTYIHFSKDCISKASFKTSKSMLSKEIHLLNNLRYYKEEIDNNESFSKKLSNHADVYINDAFAVSHRSHSSNSYILKYFKIKCIGMLMDKELKHLSNIKSNTKCCLVIGGVKISTKLKMIYNYVGKSSHILVGGAMAFTFLKAMKINIGSSLYEKSMIDEAKDLLKLSKIKNTKIVLPIDIVSQIKNNINNVNVCYIDEMKSNYIGLDIGPETFIKYSSIMNESDRIIWNGPLGMFEDNKFATGTQSICSHIKDLTKVKKVISIVGGGDTIRAINTFTNTEGFTHVSTGGGASLKILGGEEINFISSWNKYD